MQYLNVFVCCTLLFLLGSCAGGKEVSSVDDWKGKTLQFGSGGGFAGKSDTYTLLENGQLFLASGIAEAPPKLVKKIEKKKAKALFAEAAKAGWGDRDINQPGNMYYKLGYNNGNIKRQITWGDGTYKLPSDLNELYNNLQTITK